jgi:hypothetical protein
VNALNRLEYKATQDPEILTRVAQYEMAFRMQSSVPDLVDMSKEPASVLEMYGARPGDGSFASNCLLARRLAERGVRFIQLYHRDWDHHSGVKANVVIKAQETDRPTAALIQDLKQRGMLDDTLVVWGGEFGRTPMSQGDGRDHHIKGFSFLLAGGGIKGGISLRRHRRVRLRRGRARRGRARFPCHDAAPAGHRPQAPDGEVPGAGCALDGDCGERGERDFGVISTVSPQPPT